MEAVQAEVASYIGLLQSNAFYARRNLDGAYTAERAAFYFSFLWRVYTAESTWTDYTAALQALSRDVAKGTVYTPFWGFGNATAYRLDTFVLPGSDDLRMTTSNVTGALPDGVYLMTFPGASSWCRFELQRPVHTCDTCEDGTFNPYETPVSNMSAPDQRTSDVRANGGLCYACPDYEAIAAAAVAAPPIRTNFFAAGDVFHLFLNWSTVFVPDTLSGALTYSYALGTSVGGAQLLPFTDAGAAVTAVVPGPPSRLGMQPGAAVFATIVARDAVGNPTFYADTSAVVWSPTGPLAGAAKDATLDLYSPPGATVAAVVATNGTGGSAANATLPRKLQGRRLGSTTASTLRISAAAAGCSGSATCHRLRSLVVDAEPAPSGSSAAGDEAAVASAPALRRLQYGVPATAPNASSAAASPPLYNWRDDPTLTDITHVTDLEFQPSCAALNVTFEAFADPTGVDAFAACVGSSPLSCDVLPARVITAAAGLTAQTVTLDGLALSPGVLHFVSVAAVSGTGVVAASSTDGVVCENRPPSAAGVAILDTGRHYILPHSIPGAGRAANGGLSPQDVDCDVEGAGVGAAWRGFAFFVGLDHYEWALGSRPGLTDLLPWTSVGVSTSVYNASLFVPAGMAYFATVRAVDAAGQATAVTSDGVLVLPPLAEAAAGSETATFRNTTAASLPPAPRGTFVCLGSPSLLGGRGGALPIGLDTLA